LQERLEVAAAHRALGVAYAGKEMWEEAKQSIRTALGLFKELLVPHETAKTCLAAGRLKAFTPPERLGYLWQAEEIFEDLGCPWYLGEIDAVKKEIFSLTNGWGSVYTVGDLKRAEKDLLMQAFKQADGNQKEAAVIAGMPYSTFRRKLKKYGLQT
jgi:transcriptional regulator of acetoin/glycerol metabolism